LAGRVARRGKILSTVFSRENSERNISIGYPSRKRKDNIKIDFKLIKMESCGLKQRGYCAKCRAVVNAVTNVWVFVKRGEFHDLP
jgi:hypothetical protein